MAHNSLLLEQTRTLELTGRRIEYAWNGSAFVASRAQSEIVIYVDGTNGTDGVEYGTASGVDAFKTIQYAINQMPKLLNGFNLTVYISQDVYAETVTISGFSGGSVYLYGTLVSLKVGTLGAGSVQGNGATRGTAVDNVGGMGVNAYENKLLYFVTGVNAGTYRVIDSNTANAFTVIGTWPTGAPAAGDDYSVLDWGTQVTTFSVNVDSCVIDSIESAFIVRNKAVLNAYRCKLGAFYAWCVYCDAGRADLRYCFVSVGTSGSVFLTNINSLLLLYNCKLDGSGSVLFALLSRGGYAYIAYGTTINNYDFALGGVYAQNGSSIEFEAAASVGYPFVTNCLVYGLRAETGSVIVNTINNQYAGNGTNESAVAAQYAYID